MLFCCVQEVILPSWFFADALAGQDWPRRASGRTGGVFQMLVGLERRVGLLGIRRFPSSGLECNFVILAKLLPGAQEDLEGLCQDLTFGQKEALVTLHGPKPARLASGVAIACVFAIIALLLVVHASRVACLAVALVGIASLRQNASRLSSWVYAPPSCSFSSSQAAPRCCRGPNSPRDVKHTHKLQSVLTMNLALSDALGAQCDT